MMNEITPYYLSMDTLVAFVGFRDPFYSIENEVRSQASEVEHQKYFAWLKDALPRALEGNDRDLVKGPILTALRELRLKEGINIRNVHLVYTSPSKIDPRAEALAKLLKSQQAGSLRVTVTKLAEDKEPVAVHRYDTAYRVLSEQLPKAIAQFDNKPVVALIGPGTPAMNVALSALAGKYPESIKLVQVLTPNFKDTDHLLCWLNFDGEDLPILTDREALIKEYRQKLAVLELEPRTVTAPENVKNDEELRKRLEAYELELWKEAIRNAARAAASEGKKISFTEVGRQMGCTRQNATKRMKALGLLNIMDTL